MLLLLAVFIFGLSGCQDTMQDDLQLSADSGVADVDNSATLFSTPPVNPYEDYGIFHNYMLDEFTQEANFPNHTCIEALILSNNELDYQLPNASFLLTPNQRNQILYSADLSIKNLFYKAQSYSQSDSLFNPMLLFNDVIAELNSTGLISSSGYSALETLASAYDLDIYDNPNYEKIEDMLNAWITNIESVESVLLANG
ncbi:MAG: hypothetical protein JJT94_03735 [Bernardetiaceae bacterium]|nr:hypothetical protein [Bernardetiaceae bacterium]